MRTKISFRIYKEKFSSIKIRTPHEDFINGHVARPRKRGTHDARLYRVTKNLLKQIFPHFLHFIKTIGWTHLLRHLYRKTLAFDGFLYRFQIDPDLLYLLQDRSGSWAGNQDFISYTQRTRLHLELSYPQSAEIFNAPREIYLLASSPRAIFTTPFSQSLS